MAQKLTLVPTGGLANRMKAMASAYLLSKRTGVEVDVIWFCEWGLECKFNRLFQPIESEGYHVREATLRDKMVNIRPRRHTLWLSYVPQRMIYQSIIRENDVKPLQRSGFDFDAWALEGGRRYLACFTDFGAVDDSVYGQLFKPSTEVARKVEAYTSGFEGRTVGLHIRRTDNVRSIRESPDDLFFEAADAELAANDSVKFFLATDDESVKQAFRSRYGDRIITSTRPASRDDAEGVVYGLVDLFTLAHTDFIYGSAGSTFSVMASQLGNRPLKTLTK